MIVFLKFFFVLILPSLVLAQSLGPVHNVCDYDAIGDGHTDDTNPSVSLTKWPFACPYKFYAYKKCPYKTYGGRLFDPDADNCSCVRVFVKNSVLIAFMKAWEAACISSSSSTTMHIPANKTFLIHPLYFEGRCNPQNIDVEINGNIIAPSNPSEWRCDDGDCAKWIHFKHVDGLSVYGFGTIYGRGEKWWDSSSKRAPTALEISDSKNVRVSGLSFKNNPRMHVVFSDLSNLYVSNITIDAPGDSPNTDGIHISGCTHVFVDQCNIKTGDDCISIVDGSSYLQISNITCGPGHGISIGSLGKNGANDKVEYVEVRDAIFRGATNGARIKTWQGGRGYARHILFERILFQESDNPIIIDQFYCDHEHCENHEAAVEVSHVTFRQMLGATTRETAVRLECSATVPCRDIVMDNIDLRLRDGRNASLYCNNAHGRSDGQRVPDVPCLNQT